MTERDTKNSLTLEERRADNLRHVRNINSYWQARGVEANARVVERSLGFETEDGRSQTVRSAEIVSDLGPMMGRALRLAAA